MASIPVGGLVERELEVEDPARVDRTVPDQVDQLGHEPAHRSGPAVQVDVGEEDLLTGQLHTMSDADVPPSRAERMACIIDSWVPTASITECAPSRLVSSLILATPSSPRSSTISVAPNSVQASAGARDGKLR
jgi:hypothetical protein